MVIINHSFSASIYIKPNFHSPHSHILSLTPVINHGFSSSIFNSLFSSISLASMYCWSKLILHPTNQDWQWLPSDLHWADPWWRPCGPPRSQSEKQYLRPWYPYLAAHCQVMLSPMLLPPQQHATLSLYHVKSHTFLWSTGMRRMIDWGSTSLMQRSRDGRYRTIYCLENNPQC